MFIRRKEFDALKDEIQNLKRQIEYENEIVVYKKQEPMFFMHWRDVPKAKISVKDLVRNLADRMGFDLTYSEGKQPSVEIAPKIKAKR